MYKYMWTYLSVPVYLNKCLADADDDLKMTKSLWRWKTIDDGTPEQQQEKQQIVKGNNDDDDDSENNNNNINESHN